MKRYRLIIPGIATFIFFPLLFIREKRRKGIYVFLLLILVSLNSCFLNFYRTNTKPSIDEATMANLRSENKYFIIHFNGSTKGLEQVSVNGDTLTGKLV